MTMKRKPNTRKKASARKAVAKVATKLADETQSAMPAANRDNVNAVAREFNTAMTKVGETGNLLTTVVSFIRKLYRSRAIPKPDQDAILDKLAELRGWSTTKKGKASAAQIRKSEVRAVLKQYTSLPEAIVAFKKKNNGACTYHNAVSLARLLEKNKGSVTKAVTGMTKRATASAADPSTLSRADAKKAVAIASKRVLKMTALEKGFRDALRELCGEYGIKLGTA